jgi:exopolyphosphatase/guanosine-5'-triphosphate,3'-diphosphate pyrophosphatase
MSSEPNEAGRGERGPTSFPISVAGIDMGSNAIRFIAAEFRDASTFRTLDEERVPVRLGHDVFLSGRLATGPMDAATEALQSFRKRIDALGITTYRAVATSAVRESSNGAEFLKRLKRVAGIDVEAITGAEEARLVHVAVRSRLPLGRRKWVLVDLGGGSVEVSVVDETGILWSESHSMGSVRLLEELSGSDGEPGRFRELLAEYTATLRIPAAAQFWNPAGFVATGGNIEELAQLATGREENEVTRLPLEDLRRVTRTLASLPYRRRVDELHLREDRADVILPAAMVYERLAVLAGAEIILVPHVGVKEGILLDLVDDLARHVDHEARTEQFAFDGAVLLGRRFMFDEEHGVHVARLAGSLFDQLRPIHALADRDRKLLTGAAMLHDVGNYISRKKHHKHSFYIISESELTGYSASETALVANIARYHRKGAPADHHEPYMKLSDEDRRRVLLLASILRLADALDREHLQRAASVRAVVKGDELVLTVSGTGNLLLESWALHRNAALFKRAFGLDVRLHNAQDDA